MSLKMRTQVADCMNAIESAAGLQVNERVR